MLRECECRYDIQKSYTVLTWPVKSRGAVYHVSQYVSRMMKFISRGAMIQHPMLYNAVSVLSDSSVRILQNQNRDSSTDSEMQSTHPSVPKHREKAVP